MKKILMLALVGCSCVGVYSQIEKKTVLLGATSNFSVLSYKNGSNSTSYFNVSPKIGYFLLENFMAGLDVSYTSSNSTSVTGIGIFSRYYLKGKFFLGAGYSFYTYGGSSFLGPSPNYGQFNAEGGYAAFINKNVAIEPAIVYSNSSGDLVNNSTFGMRIGFSIYINRQ